MDELISKDKEISNFLDKYDISYWNIVTQKLIKIGICCLKIKDPNIYIMDEIDNYLNELYLNLNKKEKINLNNKDFSFSNDLIDNKLDNSNKFNYYNYLNKKKYSNFNKISESPKYTFILNSNNNLNQKKINDSNLNDNNYKSFRNTVIKNYDKQKFPSLNYDYTTYKLNDYKLLNNDYSNNKYSKLKKSYIYKPYFTNGY